VVGPAEALDQQQQVQLQHRGPTVAQVVGLPEAPVVVQTEGLEQ
jgi:hypothetical protein